MADKKTKQVLPHTRGVLDWIDILMGRFSDSDSSQPGKRKRSWGATIMFWCMIPAFVLVFAQAFQLVYSTIKTPMVSVNAKKVTPTPGKKTKPIKVSTAPTPKIDIGWPIVTLAGLILVVGVGYSLLRRQQDLDRALKLGKMVAEVKHGVSGGEGNPGGGAVSSETTSFLENTLKTVVGQVTGNTPAPDPKLEMVDEWAERAKQQQAGGAT